MPLRLAAAGTLAGCCWPIAEEDEVVRVEAAAWVGVASSSAACTGPAALPAMAVADAHRVTCLLLPATAAASPPRADVSERALSGCRAGADGVMSGSSTAPSRPLLVPTGVLPPSPRAVPILKVSAPSPRGVTPPACRSQLAPPPGAVPNLCRRLRLLGAGGVGGRPLRSSPSLPPLKCLLSGSSGTASDADSTNCS